MSEHEKKRRIPFVIMLVLNIILAAAVMSFLHFYVAKSNSEQMEEEMSSTRDKAVIMAGQIGDYLLSMDMVGGTYTEYIMAENLDLEAAVKYLNHWKAFYNDMALLNVRTHQAYRIGHKNGMVDMSEVDWAMELCNQYDTNVSQPGKVTSTDIFYNPETNEKELALYKPLTVQGEKYLLLFYITTESLENGGMSVHGLDPGQSVVVDGDGHVIMGNISEMLYYCKDNYYEFLKRHYGDEIMQQKTALLQNEEYGEYALYDPDGREWKCFFQNITTTNDWMYIYHKDVEEEVKSNTKSMKFALLSSMMMGVWLLFDIIVYYVYNKKLRKSMKIIEEQNQNLITANIAKTSFVSNMSHEIRTPINAVLGMDEMIIRECTDEKIRAYAYDIQDAGKVLLGIINNVLDFSKIESGKMEIVSSEYNLTMVLNEIYNMIDIKAKSKYLKLDMIVSNQIPEILYGDETRLRQIIINLLTNAVKYTEKGVITFRVDYEKSGENDIDLKVSVKDTGIGIKPEDLDKLFSEYDRIDLKRNSKIEGTGLGLPIVGKLLEMMDSKLKVESVYGLGSEFSFSLKQKVVSWEPVGDVLAKRQQNSERKAETEIILRASRAHILAVDDTAVNLMVLKGLLKRTGIQIDTAADGIECLDKMEKNRYDLVLLDHRMPRMDGIETIHKIREQSGPNQHIPVIALTANVISGAKEMYIKEGFNDFLSKPINGIYLEEIIRDYLPEELLDTEEEPVEVPAEEATKTTIKEAPVKIIEGFEMAINRNAGIAACGDESVYAEVLEVFAEEAKERIEKIRKYQQDRALKDYTVQVHGLKSSAKLVGAELLSEEAFALEKSAKAGDWEAIDAGTEKLLLHYEQVARLIAKN